MVYLEDGTLLSVVIKVSRESSGAPLFTDLREFNNITLFRTTNLNFLVLLVQILLSGSNLSINISFQQVTINFILLSHHRRAIAFLKMGPILFDYLSLFYPCPVRVCVHIGQPVQQVFYFGFALFQLLCSRDLERESSQEVFYMWVEALVSRYSKSKYLRSLKLHWGD